VQDLVQALHRSTPDILLVGLNLKGFDFLSFIEQRKIRYPLLKVIVLSSSDDLSQSKELLDAGVNAILPRESEDDVAAAAILAVAENDIFFNELVSRALLTRLRRKNLGTPVDALRLSKNEIRVLELLADGCKTQEIADRIFLSVKSVENIRYHLKIKAGVSSSISLVAYALRNRLIR
jgi:DNA-binding NarL/FixJ family response regulator